MRHRRDFRFRVSRGVLGRGFCWKRRCRLGRSGRFQQFPAKRRVRRAAMRVEDGKSENQSKKDAGEPGRDRGQNGRGLSAENVFRHAAAEGRAQPFAFRTLHQNDEHHEQGHERLEHEQGIDQNGHRDGQYDQSRAFVHGEGGAIVLAHRHFAMNPDAVHDPEPEHDHERERTAVTDQRQRQTRDRQNRDRHPDILEDVGENEGADSDD